MPHRPPLQRMGPGAWRVALQRLQDTYVRRQVGTVMRGHPVALCECGTPYLRFRIPKGERRHACAKCMSMESVKRTGSVGRPRKVSLNYSLERRRQQWRDSKRRAREADRSASLMAS